MRELRDLIQQFDHARATDNELTAGRDLVQAVRELLDEPTNVQALALARLMRDRPGCRATVLPNPFGLPDGYWEVMFPSAAAHGFVCGISPEGEVSS